MEIIIFIYAISIPIVLVKLSHVYRVIMNMSKREWRNNYLSDLYPSPRACVLTGMLGGMMLSPFLLFLFFLFRFASMRKYIA